MRENPALLAAVAANPADDLPRLVYADWLDENSQPERAEFIRVQIALVRSAFDSADRSKLAGRQTQLLKTWNTLLDPGDSELFDRELFDRASFRPVFSRGFLTEVIFPTHPRTHPGISVAVTMAFSVGNAWQSVCKLFTQSPLVWKIECPGWFYLVVVPVANGGWVATRVLHPAPRCTPCNGRGYTNSYAPVRCKECDGQGHTKVVREFGTAGSRTEMVERVLRTQVAGDLFGVCNLPSHL